MASANMCTHATTFKKIFLSINYLFFNLKCISNAIPVFKKAKSLIIKPTVILKIHVFTCSSSDGRTASQPAC